MENPKSFFCPFHDLLSLFFLSFTSNIREIIECEKKYIHMALQMEIVANLFVASFHCHFQSWEVHSYRRPGILFIFSMGSIPPFRYLLVRQHRARKKKFPTTIEFFFHPAIPRFVPVRILSGHTHEKKEKKRVKRNRLPRKKRE